jgi:hypothetical protein
MTTNMTNVRDALATALEQLDDNMTGTGTTQAVSMAGTSCGGMTGQLGLPGLSFVESGDGSSVSGKDDGAETWPVALPLTPAAAEDLIARCPHVVASGFGQRGATETLRDPEVRLAYEVGAQHVSIGNPRWDAEVQFLTRGRVAAGLGCEPTELSAELYKVLVYPVGGHFSAHVDTEKVPGMIATLVVQVPSCCEGGVLSVCDVRPGEASRTYDFGAATETAEHICHFAAFYCDAPHEVLPVTAGVRVTLV